MTRCRLYIDEVENGDLKAATNNPNQRYLSLTGIVTRAEIHADRFEPELAAFKGSVFGAGGNGIILHRREIVRREGVFACLLEEERSQLFNKGLLRLFRQLPYLATTIVIDKKIHLNFYGEWTRDPYHYCLQAMVERYVLWMHRHDYVGDVIIEARTKQLDRRVKETFQGIYNHGTENMPAKLVKQRLTSREIKLAVKSDNIAAMQIVDLLAHPSFRSTKFERLEEKCPDDFGAKVVDILERWKYSRHPKTLIKDGWGKKWLPK